jgi:outer membrane protein OmpA-like peptidoglycan-associated protein
MRILITGFVIFVIWCIISAWLYNDKLLPVINKPVTIPTIPEAKTNEADSLMRLKASLPENLMIYFEFNETKFKTDPNTDSKIAELMSFLDKHSGSMLLVSGNTDLVGTAEFNKALGLRRALTVEKYLEARGINSTRIITESQGEDKPVANYLTEEGRAKNRRTEISIKMQ